MPTTGIVCVIAGVLGAMTAVADGDPKVDRHLAVYREKGRFGGWPANHGIWSWGDEILVGFSRGWYKDLGNSHHIDREKPEEFLLARSRDGGRSWSIETPNPPGIFTGASGMRHGKMPEGVRPESLAELTEPIDFTHPDLAFTVRMEDANRGVSRFLYSYDRGKTWRGPYRLPLFDQPGILARTDYIVNGKRDCTLLLAASKSNGKEGRPLAVRTTDGGLTWRFLSFIGPEPTGYAIMPSSVKVGPHSIVTTVRRKDPPRSWIDAYRSDDDGSSWSLVSTPEPDTGEGNPPSLLRLADGRLCLVYAIRKAPFGIYARMSTDEGKTWSPAYTLRDDGGGRDIGYVRAVQLPDGKVVAIYYYHEGPDPSRYIACTIFDPGRP
ncbi:MAG: sialidase family protein [Isosphaeraceae bacterium]|nr:sialidase family protein [Isosphaeraceae bacterium]